MSDARIICNWDELSPLVIDESGQIVSTRVLAKQSLDMEARIDELEAKVRLLEKQRVSQNKSITSLTTDMEEMESMLFAAFNNSESGMSYFNWEHNLKEHPNE